MAKLHGIFGKGTGKIGNVVLAVSHGVQIAREYNGKPANPKSAAQTASRTRLKLMSQISAVMAADIAIRRIGLKSARNLFVKQNYPLSYNDGLDACVDLDRVQLTKSVVGLPSFIADRTDGQGINVSLSTDATQELSRMVYVAYVKQTDMSLRKLGSVVTDVAGANGTFPAVLPYTGNAVVVLAYGVRDLSEKATVMFGNLRAQSSEEVARLLASRVLSVRDVAETETIGLQMAIGEQSNESESVERASVSLNAIGNGSVAGAGRYVVGTFVTVHATAGSNAEFAGWYDAATGGNLMSSDADYGFIVEQNVELYARFVGAPVTVTVESENLTKGTVSGGGTVEAGENVTIHAVAASGYQFSGWYRGETLVSSLADYTFAATTNVTLVAKFEEYTGPTTVTLKFMTGSGVDAWSHRGTIALSGIGSATVDATNHTLTYETTVGSTLGRAGTGDGNWYASGYRLTTYNGENVTAAVNAGTYEVTGNTVIVAIMAEEGGN